LSTYLRLGLPSGLFHSGGKLSKGYYNFWSSPKIFGAPKEDDTGEICEDGSQWGAFVHILMNFQVPYHGSATAKFTRRTLLLRIIFVLKFF
jgi:hypothetical protein